MTDAGYCLKVSFKDQNRRFLLQGLVYDDLLAMAAERFGCNDTSALYFQHHDPDGDLVTISSSDELAEAARLTSAGATLRLVLSERAAAKDDDTSATVEEAVPTAKEDYFHSQIEAALNFQEKFFKEKEGGKRKEKAEEEEEKRKGKAEKEEEKRREKEEKKREKAEKEKEKIAKIVAEVLQAQGISPSPSPSPSPAPSVAAAAERNLLSYRSPELDVPEAEAVPAPEETGAPEPAHAAAPTEEHLRALVEAAIAGLELDRARVYARLDALSPAELQAQLAALPPMAKMAAQHLFADPAAAPGRAFPFPFPFPDFPLGPPPPPHGGPPPPPPHEHISPPMAYFAPRGCPGAPWRAWMNAAAGARPEEARAPRGEGRGCGRGGEGGGCGRGGRGGGRGLHHHHHRGPGPHHHHGPHHGQRQEGEAEVVLGELPAVPGRMLQVEAAGAEVEALHRNLAFAGYLQVRPRFWASKAALYTPRTAAAVSAFQRDHNITPVEPGVFDADTRDSLASKVEAIKAHRAAEPQPEERKEERKEERGEAAAEVLSVEVTDTDGDEMLFVLIEGRVSEFVNGELELESVEQVWIDARAGTVIDAKGRFTLIPDHRPRLRQLRALLARVGAEVAEVDVRRQEQERTVVVDVDLEASAEAQEARQGKAEAAVRAACAAMGVDAGTALSQLQRLFHAAPAYASQLAGEEAGQAVAAGLARASEEVERAGELVAAEMRAAELHAAQQQAAQQEPKQEQAEPAREEEFESASSQGDEDFVDVAEEEEEEEAKAEEVKEKEEEASEEEAVWGKHDAAVVQLMGMGFATEGPTPELIALLEECEADVSRVVERLLSRV
mmetsp:Transcript_28971/g.69352  ORF Transcript_28971/g.69352 Transcript_28971/m.69352 type:complete len:840 (+) Transcript_28971:119-2638(+)